MPSFEDFLDAHPEQKDLSHDEQLSNYDDYIENILCKFDY